MNQCETCGHGTYWHHAIDGCQCYAPGLPVVPGSCPCTVYVAPNEEVVRLRRELDNTITRANDMHESMVYQRDVALHERDVARAIVADIEWMCNEFQLNAAVSMTFGHCADLIRQSIDGVRAKIPTTSTESS